MAIIAKVDELKSSTLTVNDAVKKDEVFINLQ